MRETTMMRMVLLSGLALSVLTSPTLAQAGAERVVRQVPAALTDEQMDGITAGATFFSSVGLGTTASNPSRSNASPPGPIKGVEAVFSTPTDVNPGFGTATAAVACAPCQE
jgi:hypothetical protein